MFIKGCNFLKEKIPAINISACQLDDSMQYMMINMEELRKCFDKVEQIEDDDVEYQPGK